MNTAVRRRVLVAAAPLLAVGLSACSMHEQTQEWYDPTDGASVDAGDIAIRNVVVVADDERATLLATFANHGEADQLVEVLVDGVPAESWSEPLELPAGGFVSLGPDTTRLDLAAGELAAGLDADIEFRFASAPRAALDALVQAPEGLYADALIPLGTHTPTHTFQPEPTDTPADTAPPEPSGTGQSGG